MKTLQYILLSLFTTSCLMLAAAPPTENQGANAMAAKVREESKGLLRLIKFTKTNGQKSLVNGIEMYTMECTVEALAVDDCGMTAFEGSAKGWRGSFHAEKGKFEPYTGPVPEAFSYTKPVAKGAIESFITKLEFDLTERGWRTEGLLPADKPFVPDKTLSQVPEQPKVKELAWERPGTKEAAAVKVANTELDRVYNELMSSLDSKQQKTLKEEELAWIKWRDSEMIRTVGQPRGGSAYRLDYLDAILSLVQKRIMFLKDYQKNLKGVSDASVKRDVSIVCPEGKVGEFSFALECTGYYNKNVMVDIQVAGTPSKVTFDQTKRLLHMGVDIAAREGSNILPIADGTVSDVLSDTTDRHFKSLGYMVMIKHDVPTGNAYSLYLHMGTAPSVKVGQQVIAGKTVLGLVGHTGAAFGNHLHMEVRKFPYRFFPRWGNIYGVAQSDNDFAIMRVEAANSWVDPSSFVKNLGGADSSSVIPEQAIPQASKLIVGKWEYIRGYTLVVLADGTRFSTRGGGKSATGRWRIEGNKLLTQFPDGQETSEAIFSLDDHELVLEYNAQPLHCARIKE